jgi:L-asparaginase
VEASLGAFSRPVRLLAAGGTIAMGGPRAVPALDAEALVEAVPALSAVPDFGAETVLGSPGPHLELPQALELARQASRLAGEGAGVVITTGTDTLEEVAVVCAFLHGGEAPVVLTGASRPATRAGADGPANLVDAVAVAGSKPAAGLGTVVVFGGEIHAAMTVRKVDSTGPATFGSPVTGPLGRVVEGRVWLHARPLGSPRLDIDSLEHRVEIVYPGMGDDGALLRLAAESADGVVLVAFGAGHLSPGLLRGLRAAVARIPVIVTCRPERSAMFVGTYGFEGSEGDVRASGAVCAPFLSAQAARVALLCCLGAGLDRERTALALRNWDVA